VRFIKETVNGLNAFFMEYLSSKMGFDLDLYDARSEIKEGYH
jgi:hypothetical protein